MNSTVYIFGTLSNGYTQYPNDFTADIFKEISARARAKSQIVIHRNGNLMYYAYIRKLKNAKYIGLCVVLNGVMITQFDKLFTIYQHTIETLAREGYFIGYDDRGNLVPTANELSDHKHQIDEVQAALKLAFNGLATSAQHLPPVDYTENCSSEKHFSQESGSSEILESSYKRGYTFIHKNKDTDTPQMNSFKGVLLRITKENEQLQAVNKTLSDENKHIIKKQKQYKFVSFLAILLVIAGLFLFALNRNLDSVKQDLIEANEDISLLDTKIEESKLELDEKDKENKRLQTTLKQKDNQLREVQERCRSLAAQAMPIKITDIEVANVYYDNSVETNYGNTIYSSKTMYLRPRITYTGADVGTHITLQIKFYDQNGKLYGGQNKTYTYAIDFDVQSGRNVKECLGYGGKTKGFWGKGNCSVEVWWNGYCLYTKHFTIY